MQLTSLVSWQRYRDASRRRRGVFMVIAALMLAIVMTFIAFSVDTGIISLTKTRMQNATDSAALAAAMEITDAIANAGAEVSDVFTHAQVLSRDKAEVVADLNSVYIDPAQDVTFGRRYRDSAGAYQFDWNPAGYQVNCVKVVARRDNADTKQPDGQIPGLFTGLFKTGGTSLTTTSIAYIEPRDMVVVHDFSRSMNFDSYFTNETTSRLSKSQIENNLQLAWTDLNLSLGSLEFTPANVTRSLATSDATAAVTFTGKSVKVTSNTAIKTVKVYFENSGSQTFNISGESTKTGTWSGTYSNSNKRISSVALTIRKVGSSSQSWTMTYSYDTSTFQNHFGISNVSWPYSSGSWSAYVSYVKSDAALDENGYRDMYGGMTLMCYLMKSCSSYNECKDLWKTRHYPFHAIKEGHYLLCDFLTDLGFDDYLGMVSYDTSHRIETTISSDNPEFPSVNLSSSPLSNQYSEIKKLIQYKQASHYSDATNMSGGLKDGIALLDEHKRDGSRPAILLMTDGNSNQLDSGESGSLPTGWDWNTLFDYDDNGSADYSTTSSQRTAVLKYVKQAVDKGYTVHAISVGADADTDLLNAVAWLGKGSFVHVPGGSSVSDMESQVRDAFIKIASSVPPARLVKPE